MKANDIIHFVARDEGSTRPLALLRIATVFLLWARYAERFTLWRILPGGLGLDTSATEAAIMAGLGALFLISSVGLLVGYKTQASAGICAVSQLGLIYYLGYELGRRGWAHHHTQLLICVTAVLAFSPSGNSFSVDRWRSLDKDPLPERAPLTGHRLLMVMTTTIYFWAAVDKLHYGFVSGEDLQRYFIHYYTDSELPSWAWFGAATRITAWITIALEFALAFGLWWRKGRRWLMPAGALMHLTMYFTMEIFTFTLSMLSLYLLFFEPDAVHQVIDRLTDKGLNSAGGERPQKER